jgi:hypothetical protein
MGAKTAKVPLLVAGCLLSKLHHSSSPKDVLQPTSHHPFHLSFRGSLTLLDYTTQIIFLKFRQSGSHAPLPLDFGLPMRLP